MYRDTKQLLSDTKFYESYARYDEEKKRYETWDEAVDRVMDMHTTYYADKLSPELIGYINEATKAYKEHRVLGAQRALQFGGSQLLKHQIKMYNCFSKETKFVTSLGMKSFSDFSNGDSILVKTHLGNWKSAIVKNYSKQQLFEVQIGKDKSSLKKFYVTRNHRWILEDGSVTDNLNEGDILFNFADKQEFDWDKASEEEKLYWCYGLIFGDGTVNGNYSMIRLCGKDIRFLSRFEYFGFKHTNNLSLNGDVIIFTGKYKKTLPNLEIDSLELINAFVNGYLSADGTKGSNYWNGNESHFCSIYAKDENACNFIRNIFPTVGYHISNEKCTMRKTNFGISDGHHFSFVSQSNSKFQKKNKVFSIKPTDRYEDVWCLEVEDDHSFILEHGIPTGNCTSSYADRPAFFGEAFYILLCGAGVGFSVQKHHVAKLPSISHRTKQPKTHIVEDSIEGWATAFDVLLSSYFEGGGKHPEYEGRKVYFDLSQIRPKGTVISGGFKAPGPEPLRLALDRIEYLLQGLVLNNKKFKLRPIHVYDMVMHVADAVISGGVRRAATICLFSPDDDEMAKAKTCNWFEENPQRARSNNSAVIVRKDITREQFHSLMENIKQFGEPGFVFVESTEHATNPCVEIGMFPQIDGQSGWQGCNLAEINGGMCIDEESFFKACRAAAILGTLQAGYTNFKFLDSVSKKIFDREALLGCSITGWMNNPDILFNEEILERGATIIKQVNKEVAALLGINAAARTTCVKPSGNASVLLMTASGIHAEHSPMYLRHVQLNKDTEVAQLIKKLNPYMIEESVWSPGKTDYAVAFPVIAKKGSYFKNDFEGVKHLELIKTAQKHWVDAGTNIDLCVDPTVRHNVSNTITVDDWDEVEEYVFANKDSFAGISFLAQSGDKDFPQAPNTKVIEAKEMVKIYGNAAVFASGLVVEALKAFGDLWRACATANGFGEDISSDDNVNLLKRDWVRRFEKFATNHFKGDKKQAEYCLKDCNNLHKWEKIQQNLVDINFVELLTEKKFIDIDTLAAQACQGGACEI